jgi:hypothetical protein
MKNKRDAVNALSAAGWSSAEIEAVLNDASKSLASPQAGKECPWWAYMTDQHTDGSPVLADWYNWLEHEKAVPRE